MDEQAPFPEIRSQPGALPAFPRRNTVFFANLPSLFFGNDPQMRELMEEVGEIDTYGGRLIPIVDILFGPGDNVLVLEARPDESICEYFTGELELSLPDIEILDHAAYLAAGEALAEGRLPRESEVLRRVAEHRCDRVDGYVTDSTLARVADWLGKRTVSSPEGSRRGNNKRLLQEFLESSGLPALAAFTASNTLEVEAALAALAADGFSAAVVKSAIGASGIGMLKVDSLDSPREEASRVPGHFFFEGACLVQGWVSPGEKGVSALRSPSVQLFLDEDSVILYDITEQILSSRSIHEGNVSPPPYLAEDEGLREELLRQAAAAGRWLHRQGYRGTASADLLVVDREGGGSTAHVCELNARVTGATYPSVLARHFLPRGAWMLRNLRLSAPVAGKTLLEMMRSSGELFRPGTNSGILPVNFNLDREGLVQKGQFLCFAETPEKTVSLLDQAKISLPVDMKPDRD